MGRLIIDQWMTLDGVVQAPGNAQEDTDGGFRHGGWHWPHVDAITNEWVTTTTRETDVFLFGRGTYERFAAFWPDAGEEFADLAGPLNDRPKYVASTTLSAPLRWRNAHLLRGDVPRAIADLRDRTDGDIHLVGSATLARAVIAHGLVDEFRLFIEPVLVGGGKRFLPEDGNLRRLRLTDSRVTTTGVIIATYRPHDTQEHPMTDMPVPDIPRATDSDVLLTRAFAAPRDVVWRFFTEPDLLATWFGPATVHVDRATVDVDLRAGGAWDLDMVDNESGEHYPVRSKLTAVIPPEYLEGEVVGPAGTVTLRIWLHDHGAKTRMTLHQGPFSAEFRDMTGAGWEESFVKIDAQLEGMSA